jgi:hypothetical protein
MVGAKDSAKAQKHTGGCKMLDTLLSEARRAATKRRSCATSRILAIASADQQRHHRARDVIVEAHASGTGAEPPHSYAFTGSPSLASAEIGLPLILRAGWRSSLMKGD